jgi:hypothetical protein
MLECFKGILYDVEGKGNVVFEFSMSWVEG